MPTSGSPFCTIASRSTSVSAITLRTVAMLVARSPPRPSEPWQAAQLPEKICSPAAASFCCAQSETGEILIATTSRAETRVFISRRTHYISGLQKEEEEGGRRKRFPHPAIG